ncbi:PaaI family thioesterase [Enterocloster alcoholdehydrogenati]|uniref:PaaI family thioesterase n=1 Tax=Enterocloster alcoholdehydrogenati TaxID=2547410 RepID=UPI001FAD8D54|nr:PaaI family thioesterase [Enterocloster alcoholdehydrogenati]
MITRPEIMEGLRRHIQPIGGQEHLKIIEVGPGHVRLSLELTSEALNLYGSAHGGFLFSLCDIAAGMAVYAYETANVTQSADIHFVKGVRSGTVYVEATAVHKGKKTVVSQVNITDEHGALITTGTFTMFLGAAL